MLKIFWVIMMTMENNHVSKKTHICYIVKATCFFLSPTIFIEKFEKNLTYIEIRVKNFFTRISKKILSIWV